MGIMMTVKLKVEILVRIIRIFMHKYSNSNNRKTSMIKIKIFNNKISRNSNISNSL